MMKKIYIFIAAFLLFVVNASASEVDITILKELGIADEEVLSVESFSGNEISSYIKKLANDRAVMPEIPEDEVVTDRDILPVFINLLEYNTLLENGMDAEKVASSIRLTDGVYITGEAVDGEKLARLMLNVLNAYVCEPALSGEDKISYKELYREKYFDLKRASGRLLSIYNHSLYSTGNVGEGQLLIEVDSGEVVFETKKELSYLDLGTEGYFYYTDPGDGDLYFVCFERNENELLVINTADITDVSGNTADGFTVRYKVGEREKRVKTVPFADYMYNTIADSDVPGLEISADKIKNSYGELILKKTDNRYDVIFLNEYVAVVADSVSRNGTITDKFSDYVISFNEEEDDVSIIRNSEKADITDIKPDETVMVLFVEDKNKTGHFVLEVLKNTAEGEMNGGDSEEVMLDVTKYMLSKQFISKEKNIPSGNNVRLYLDKYNHVIDFLLCNEDVFYYGYIVKAFYNTEEAEPQVSVKIFDQFGNWVRYPLREKIRTNVGSVRSTDVFINGYYDFTDGMEVIKQLVKYRLNYRGEITALYAGMENDENFTKGKTLFKAAYVPSISGLLDNTSQATRLNRLYYSGKTVVFAVPPATQENTIGYYDRFKIYTPSYFESRNLEVTGYDADDTLISRVMLTSAPTAALPGEGGSLVYVKKASKVYSDKLDELVVRIQYQTASGEEFIEIAPDNNCYSIACNVIKGDIINISRTGNEVDGISRVVYGNENIMTKAPILDATAFNSDFAGIFAEVLRMDASTGLVQLLDGNREAYLFNLNGAASVILAEYGSGEAYPAQIEDITSGDRIFIRYAWKSAKEIIIIRQSR